MKQYILCLMAALCICLHATAQAPKYRANLDTTGVVSYPDFSARYSLIVSAGVKYQSIYWPSDFPTAPEGRVTNVYFQIGSASRKNIKATYYNLSVKMGPTTKKEYANFRNTTGSTRDTFVLNLPTVFSRTSYVIPNSDSPKGWIKLPLDMGNFIFTRSSNFAVEIATGPPAPDSGVWLLNYRTPAPVTYRFIGAANRPDSISNIRQGGFALSFGFDVAITPNGIDQVSNITSIGLFPNPSTDGRFMLSFDTKAAVRKTIMTATTLTGQKVWSREYDGTGTSFFKEMDMSALPKGTYAIRIEADGEAISRMVVLQ